mmetsp:Transcript_139856/g.389742  ORF Transcript_139856/g.389742 Transcript_139856/m.389742 type:complete len:206 (-) Transcript_139856:854-1471(-)
MLRLLCPRGPGAQDPAGGAAARESGRRTAHQTTTAPTAVAVVAPASGSRTRPNNVANAFGTTAGTKCPVRMTVAKRKFFAARMCPMTSIGVGHGTFFAATKSAAPLQVMFSKAFRFPMWLHTEPSRTPLYRTTSLPSSSSAATTGAEGRVKSALSASATGPVSSEQYHVTLLPTCRAAFTSGRFRYRPRVSVSASKLLASVIPKS